MIIETSSSRLATLARLARLFPPGLSGFFLRFYPHGDRAAQETAFRARASIADVWLSADRVDWVPLCFAVRGFFEWQSVVVARVVCRRGDTVIEVGANIGTESVLYAHLIGPSGQLLCFEPLPQNAVLLEKNLAQNGQSQAQVRRQAVSDRAGRVYFHAPTADENCGMGRIVEDGGASAGLEVECVTLDDLRRAGAARAPRLLVIDVQGAEMLVLRGAERILTEDRPVVVFEAEADLLAERGLTPADLFAHMRERQYQTWRITKWGLSAAVPTGGEGINCVCIPNNPEEGGPVLARRIHRAIFWSAALPLIRGLNPLMLPRG